MGSLLQISKKSENLLDKEIRRLRKLYTTTRDSRAISYKLGDRAHNARALSILWPFYEDVTLLLQFLQRMYLAQTGFSLAMRTEVLNRDGERFDVSAILDISRTLVPISQLKLDKHTKLSDDWTVDSNPDEYKLAIQEYCEMVAETQGTKVLVLVHHPKLLRKLHGSIKMQRRDAFASVNFQGKYTYVDRRMFFQKDVMTQPIEGMTVDSLTERAKKYSDSVRFLGEQLDDEVCMFPRPAVNVLMCYIVELEWYRRRIAKEIKSTHIRILTEYRKDGNPTLIGKVANPRTYVYHDEVVITEAIHPIRFMDIDKINVEEMRKMIAAKLVNIDLPLLQFRFQEKPLRMTILPHYATLWDKGKRVLEKPLNNFMQQLKGVA